MACPNLITCGDNVKIWDSNGYSLLHQFQPNNTKDDVVTDVSWSRDGGMVASLTSRQALLVVTGVTAEGTRQLTVADELVKPTCCRFCTSNSRYVCVGSHSGSVELWDNKTGKLVKHYQGHKSPVTRVCFSASDRHVASGSRSGQVLVHNVTSGVVTELPTARNEPQCVRDLRYSTVPAAVVGAAFDTGHVSLWDVNQRRLLHTFTGGHVAPASGLAFSPVNDILLASVGLDKRLVMYDPKSKGVIQTISGDAPLTALDFHSDGTQLAVGSSQGRVCVYDLRVLRRPSRSFTAHRSSVQRVQFQPPTKGQHRSSSSYVSKEPRPAGSGHKSADESTPVTRSVTARTHSTPIEDGRPPPVTANDSHVRFSQVSAEQSSLFSPIRDESGHKLTSPPQLETTLNGTAHGGYHHGRDSSMFSPVRGNISLTSGPAAPDAAVTPPDRPVPTAADTSLFSPLRPERGSLAGGSGAASDTSLLPLPALPPESVLLLNGIGGSHGLSGSGVGSGGGSGVDPSPRLNGLGRAGLERTAPPTSAPAPDHAPAPVSAAPAHAMAHTPAAAAAAAGTPASRGGRSGPDGAGSVPGPVLNGSSGGGGGGGGGGAAGDASSGADRLLTLLDDSSALDGERRGDVLAELAFGGPTPPPPHQFQQHQQQDGKRPGPPPPAHTDAVPVPHSVVERLEGLNERMEDMWWGLRRENFNTQWSVGKHMYEMKASMEGMASTMESLMSEVQRLREENQYLGCKF